MTGSNPKDHTTEPHTRGDRTRTRSGLRNNKQPSQADRNSSGPGPGRVTYKEAGALGRDVLLRGNRLLVEQQITPRQLRTLVAVVAFTALFSRTEDRGLYLAQLAAFANGVERATESQTRHCSDDLTRLHEVGLIRRRAPRGRPPKEDGRHVGPRYLVELLPDETPPAPVEIPARNSTG